MRVWRPIAILCATLLTTTHASPTAWTKRDASTEISGPVLAIDDDQLAVFATRNQMAGWPVALAAIIRGGPANAFLAWTFPELGPGVLCTVNGTIDQPCDGPVVDIVFPSAGTYTVNLTVADPSTNKQFTTQTFSVNITTRSTVPKGTRREVRDLTTDQWNAFVQAAHVLKTFGVWDHLGRLHSSAMQDMSHARTAAHGGPAFLPWHRAFIRVAELNLQTAANDMSLTLPYWDWTFDQPHFSQSPILTDQYFGGNGTPSAGMALTSGHFCDSAISTCSAFNNWPVPVEFGGPTLRRAFAADSGATISTQAQMDALRTEEWYDQPPFDSNNTSGFRAGMEGWILDVYGEMHNGVHRWLGGQFSMIPTSFFDPVFVAHHSNIDRHWYEWQAAKNCSDWRGGCYAPADNDTLLTESIPGVVEVNGTWRLVGHQWSDRMWPWGIAPKDVATASIYTSWYEYAARGTQSVDAPLPIVDGLGAREFVSGARPRVASSVSLILVSLTTVVSLVAFM